LYRRLGRVNLIVMLRGGGVRIQVFSIISLGNNYVLFEEIVKNLEVYT
jgi:hypothetical protein